MPIYSFECPECGVKRDIALRLTEMDEPQSCQTIGCARTGPMDRKATAASLSFKGPGWTPKFHTS